jgi:hypothetical protein
MEKNKKMILKIKINNKQQCLENLKVKKAFILQCKKDGS